MPRPLPAGSLAPLAVRLVPGDDLRQALRTLCVDRAIDAAVVLGCVGSLQCAALRYAGRSDVTRIVAKFEILSLSGTLSRHGVHLHITIADDSGRILGGHLMDGSLVYTTVEVVLGILDGVVFSREHDPATGFRELRIRDDDPAA